jgi:arylsulfatase
LYKGKYDAGYEALTKSRFERGKALGIIPQNAQLPPLLPNVKPWESLSPAEKQSAARTMEIYAAMIDVMDVQIGRLLHFLKEKGVLDNTVILFSGDNGAEGNSIMGYEGTGEWVDTTFDNSLQNMGRVGSYVQLGSAWAQAAATPFHWYKAFSYEGGVRAPSIFHFPKHTLQNGKTNRQWLTILDIAPTVLEMAGVKHPDTVFQGKKIFLLDGKSMLPWLSGREGSAHPEHEPYVWELFGRIGVRCGDWKAVKVEKPYGTGDWELYNLRDDIGELHDLSGKNSEKTKEMAAYWDIYEKKYNVTLPNRPTAYAKENYWKK